MDNFGGVFEEEFKYIEKLFNITEVIKEDKVLEFLKDYKPNKVTDGYAVIKGTSNCNFNFARIEEYDGDREDLKGKKFIRYELQICDGQENEGRRFWKSIDVLDEVKVKKFADVLWTITGLDFKDEDTLSKALEALVTFTVEVKYWGFVGTDEKALAEKEGREPEKIQTHFIKGQAKDKGEVRKTEVPF